MIVWTARGISNYWWTQTPTGAFHCNIHRKANDYYAWNITVGYGDEEAEGVATSLEGAKKAVAKFLRAQAETLLQVLEGEPI